ncbi:unnamed protein product [Prorocentrum cordatum]|uniref:Secreted protein n=1 Tax=Prorocentrum cordatum TaxID=2364126 RepID=A0ABN9V598_9DINO|nr:unnamed protein product [Polarella glacialis]
MPTRRRKWAARQCVACSSTGILVLMPDRTAKTVRPRSRPHVLSAMRREWARSTTRITHRHPMHPPTEEDGVPASDRRARTSI